MDPRQFFPLNLPESRMNPSGPAANNVVFVVPANGINALGSEQKKFQRSNEALGAVQIVLALIHCGLGGILFFSSNEFSALTMTAWYPFWGAGLFLISGSTASAAATSPTSSLVTASHALNNLSGLASFAGVVLLVIDLIKISILNFHAVSIPLFKQIALLSSYITPTSCQESAFPPDYCKIIRSYETGLLSLMLIFTVIQLVASCSTLCSDKDKAKKSSKHKEDHNQDEAQLMVPSAPADSNGLGVPMQPYHITNQYF
uniref:Uncharacterized protein n=1 Tax=Sphenodon punctatus TaxID=8508 RepID=A0A8D0HDB8_SPHPU